MIGIKAVHKLFLGGLLVAFTMFSCGNKEQSQQATEQPQETEQSQYSQIPLIRELEDKIAQSPDSAELYYQRGSAYFELGNISKAQTDAARAISMDSLQAKYYSLLAKIYFEKEEFTRAVQVLEKAHQLLPDDIDLMLHAARYYYVIGEGQRSITLLDSVLMKNVFNPQAYFYKGMIFKEIGDTAKAISNFQTAAEQDPKVYEAYMQLGLMFSAKKDRIAVDYFNNALKVDSNSQEAQYGIGMFYQNIEDYSKAKEAYRRMIIRFPQSKLAYYNMGYIYFQEDSMDKAERSFEHALEVAPDYTEAYYMRGLCAERKKDSKSAEYYYRQALNLNPGYKLALDGIQRLEK